MLNITEICYFRLVYNLASMYPEAAEEKGLIQQMNHIFLKALVVAKMEETVLTDSYNIQTVKTMLQPCQNDTSYSPECRFILLLSGITTSFDFHYSGVENYIWNRTMAKQDVTLQSFKDYMEDYYGKIIDDKMMLFPRSDYHYVVR